MAEKDINLKQVLKRFPPGDRYKDSSRLAWYGVVGMIILLFLMSLCGCSHKTHVITEYDGEREIRWYTTNKNK